MSQIENIMNKNLLYILNREKGRFFPLNQKITLQGYFYIYKYLNKDKIVYYINEAPANNPLNHFFNH